MSASSILEPITHVTPLALRFWDAANARLVTDGLIVNVYPADAADRRTVAVANRTGAYVLYNLPGLRAVEHGAGDAAFWSAPPPTRTFIVEVVDTQRRFLPVQFSAAAPARDFLDWQCPAAIVNPARLPRSVPLFSTPTRSATATASVRIELYDPVQDRPAAWAVVEVTPIGHPAVLGMADAQGRALILFSYPEPPTPPANGNGPRLLTDQTWTVDVRVFYAPLAPAPEIPDLCTVLSRAQASLWSRTSPAQALAMPLTLRFGQELVLKSESASVLYVTAAGVLPG